MSSGHELFSGRSSVRSPARSGHLRTGHHPFGRHLSGSPRAAGGALTSYAGRIATYYDILGVAVDASTEEIRAAYLARARRHHPDVARVGADVAGDDAAGDVGSGGTTRPESMAEINRAYQVLRRPHTRRDYDRRLAAAAVRTTPAAPGGRRPGGVGTDADADGHGDPDIDDVRPSPGARIAGRLLTPSGPARMPWKLMAVTAVLGSVVVLASAALVDPPRDEAPDGILRVGSCVDLEDNGDAREVACDGAALVVRLLLPTGSDCPPAYSAHRDRLGLGTACVEAIE